MSPIFTHGLPLGSRRRGSFPVRALLPGPRARPAIPEEYLSPGVPASGRGWQEGQGPGYGRNPSSPCREETRQFFKPGARAPPRSVPWRGEECR